MEQRERNRDVRKVAKNEDNFRRYCFQACCSLHVARTPYLIRQLTFATVETDGAENGQPELRENVTVLLIRPRVLNRVYTYRKPAVVFRRRAIFQEICSEVLRQRYFSRWWRNFII